MIPYIIAAIYREVEGLKEDLANGLVPLENYRYHVGIIKGMKESIELIKDSEQKFAEDSISEGEAGWGLVGEKSGNQP
jgi:hypothetical protein